MYNSNISSNQSSNEICMINQNFVDIFKKVRII